MVICCRGTIVTDFLTSSASPLEYCTSLLESLEGKPHAFNLIVGTFNSNKDFNFYYCGGIYI